MKLMIHMNKKAYEFIKSFNWVFKWAGAYFSGIAGGLTVLSFGQWRPEYGWFFFALFILGLICYGMNNKVDSHD